MSPNNIDASQDLVRKLGITESTAKQIHSIRAHYCVDLNKDGFPDVIDKNNKYATSLDSTKAAKILPNMFHIKIQAYSSEIFPHVRQSIIDFINKNSYVQRQNARRIEEISEQISYLHQQQSRFDSLQQYEYFQKQSAKKTIGSGQLLVLNEQIQPLYHGDLIALNDQILGKNTLLQLYSEPITIIQDFTETSSRENNMMFYIKPLGIAGLLIGLIFIIIRDYRKPLWDLYNKKVSFAPKITE
ncbi:MAG: hypothetical protein LBF67_06370 [Prevotellaceae bacterium]|nr:hypothetical protein [Prevotellaceae bacterium]